jgi:hypothetical protein
MPNQMLVVNRLEDLPLLLFTARFQRLVKDGERPIVTPVVTLRALDKRTGKLILDDEGLPKGATFHTLLVDRAAGRIEFVGFQVKAIFTVEPIKAPK